MGHETWDMGHGTWEIIAKSSENRVYMRRFYCLYESIYQPNPCEFILIIYMI